MINPEVEQFTNLGLQLGRAVDLRLGVKHATFVSAEDLALIGASVYGGEKQDTRFLYLNPKKHAHDMALAYRPETLQRFGITSSRLEKLYPDLIGNGDYSKGAVANALRKADQVLDPAEFHELQFSLAELMARYVKLKPEAVKTPNARVDFQRGSLRFDNGPEHPLTYFPGIVVEYGPGLVGLRKIPAEVRLTPQTMFVETNYYVNQVLSSSGDLHGIQFPQIVTRMDGIQSTTEELLNLNGEGLVDIFIMAMVHSAGEKEIEAGIRNAHRLLVPGGLFAVQAVEQVKDGEASARFIKGILSDTFLQRPPTYNELNYFDELHRVKRDVFQAVYVR